MLRQIKGKSLDELKELITRFSQEQVEQVANNEHNEDVLDKSIKVSSNLDDNLDDTISSIVSVSSKSVFKLFARNR
jgi:hypothetical protein